MSVHKGQKAYDLDFAQVGEGQKNKSGLQGQTKAAIENPFDYIFLKTKIYLEKVGLKSLGRQGHILNQRQSYYIRGHTYMYYIALW